jgi:hypothetical protein
MNPSPPPNKAVTAVVFDSGSGETKAMWFKQTINTRGIGNCDTTADSPPVTHELFKFASFQWYITQAVRAKQAGTVCNVSLSNDIKILLGALDERDPLKRVAAIKPLEAVGDSNAGKIADKHIADWGGIPALVEMGLTAWFRELKEKMEQFKDRYGADYRYDDPATPGWQYRFVLQELSKLELQKFNFKWHALSQDEEGRFEAHAIRYAFDATNILSVPAAVAVQVDDHMHHHDDHMHHHQKWRPNGAEKLPDAIMACGTGSFQFTLPDIKDEPFLLKCGVGHGLNEIIRSRTVEVGHILIHILIHLNRHILIHLSIPFIS